MIEVGDSLRDHDLQFKCYARLSSCRSGFVRCPQKNEKPVAVARKYSGEVKPDAKHAWYVSVPDENLSQVFSVPKDPFTAGVQAAPCKKDGICVTSAQFVLGHSFPTVSKDPHKWHSHDLTAVLGGVCNGEKACCTVELHVSHLISFFQKAAPKRLSLGFPSRIQVGYHCGSGDSISSSFDLLDISCGESTVVANLTHDHNIPCDSPTRYQKLFDCPIAVALACHSHSKPPRPIFGTLDRIVVIQTDSRLIPNLQATTPYSSHWLPYGEHNLRLPFWLLNFAVNFWYAHSHDYEYLWVKNPYGHVCLHPGAGHLMVTWCKLPALLRTFAEYPDAQYFLFLDSDAYVSDASRSVESFMERAMQLSYKARQAEIIIGAEPWVDCTSKLRPPECYVNSGVMLIKNSPLAQQIIEEWWSLANVHHSPCARIHKFRWHWAFEQSVMSAHIWPKYQEHILRLPTDEMNGPYGKFVKHFWGSKAGWPLRIPKFSDRILKIVKENAKFADMRQQSKQAQVIEFVRRVLPNIQQKNLT